MIRLAEELEPVDFATLSKNLYMRVLENLGDLPVDKCIVDTSDPQDTVYRIMDSPRKRLLDIIHKYKQQYEYEVLDSHNGSPIEINKLT